MTIRYTIVPPLETPQISAVIATCDRLSIPERSTWQEYVRTLRQAGEIVRYDDLHAARTLRRLR
jgi:hypothetical protein